MRCYCACFQSTSSIRWPNEPTFTQQQFCCSIFFDKGQSSLNMTPLDSLKTVAKRLDFSLDLMASKNHSSDKISRVAWPELEAGPELNFEGGNSLFHVKSFSTQLFAIRSITVWRPCDPSPWIHPWLGLYVGYQDAFCFKLTLEVRQ